MSISTRITSMQEHIGDIYDTLELGGVDLANVNKNLINISPKLKQKYLDYMNNGTQEIWNNWEKVTGTGSDLKLNNTVQAPMDLGVGGNSEQVQYSGKNKASNIYSDYTYNDSTGGYALFPITLEEGQTYTLSAELIGTLKTSYYNYGIIKSGTSYSDFNGLKTPINYATGTAGSYTFTVDNTYTSPKLVCFIQGSNPQNKFNELFTNYKIQFEKSSSATSYEPYVGGTASPSPSFPQPITNVTGDVEVLVQNKNLANFDIASFQFRVLTEKINANTFKVKKNYQSGAATYGQIEMNLKPNTNYTIIFTSDKTDSLVSCWKDYNGAGNIKTNLAVNTPFSFTTTQEKFICGLYMNNDLAQNTEVLFQFMILEGTYTAQTIPPYTPHKEQTFTFPLGTQRMYLGDYLADDGIHHVKGQVVFDGSETWYIGTYAPANSVQFLTSKPNDFFIETGTEGLAKIKSSHFINQDTVNGMRIGSYIAFFPSNSYNITTVEDFKTWLSTHNVTVEYELAEEEITPYTTEQQQAYDEIKQAISYEEQTNISGESDEAKPIFTVVALKNI